MNVNKEFEQEVMQKLDEMLYRVEKIEEELDYLNRATFKSVDRLDKVEF